MDVHWSPHIRQLKVDLLLLTEYFSIMNFIAIEFYAFHFQKSDLAVNMSFLLGGLFML